MEALRAKTDMEINRFEDHFIKIQEKIQISKQKDK